MKGSIFFLLGGLAAVPALAQTKPAELLLIGTFHFHNPGGDVTKSRTLDVLAPPAQAELEDLATRIARFGPRKIFVEWAQAKQAELDTVYSYYRQGQAAYQAYINTRYPASQHGLFLRSELPQLAFRAGKKAGLTRIYGLDYTGTSFPYDSVQHALREAHQDSLRLAIDHTIAARAATQNQLLVTLPLGKLLLALNAPANLAANKALYLNILNRAGTVANFAGPFLVSEWYRRNLYMYSVIQKTVTPADARVLVLVGSGHAAMMRDFVAYDSAFKLKPLQEVLAK